MRNLILTLLLAATITANRAEASDPLAIYPTFWGKAALHYGVDPYILYAIALVESRKKSDDGLFRPSPWAIMENGKRPVSHYPKSLEEAKILLHLLLAKTKNLDIGMMQVNLKHHGHRVKNPEDLFDPETNILVGSQILKEALNSSPGELVTGVGRYHHWADPVRSWNYGTKVLTLARSMRGDLYAKR